MGNLLINKLEAIDYLGIDPKHFDNYHRFSEEIKGRKMKGRWYFNRNYLIDWKKLKEKRTIFLSLNDYEKCFEFAIKMVYGGLSLHGIRGMRTEVQAADDVILGILAEHAIKKFLSRNFKVKIKLDEEVHTHYITPQDFEGIKKNGKYRKPKLGVGVKASKMKNAYLILGGNEFEDENRHSDIYIFCRVGLPPDHLFRILRSHSFFGKVRKFLEDNDEFKQIRKLENIPVWICGYVFDREMEKAKEIPGQKFSGTEDVSDYRYVKSVSKLHNSDDDWKNLIKKL